MFADDDDPMLPLPRWERRGASLQFEDDTDADYAERCLRACVGFADPERSIDRLVNELVATRKHATKLEEIPRLFLKLWNTEPRPADFYQHCGRLAIKCFEAMRETQRKAG